MRATEFLSENDEPVRLKLRPLDNGQAKAWIERVYQKYPYTMQNNHVMVWGSGDDQQFAMFELIPSFSKRGAVEVKWFQAYPLRQGVGSRAMQELQAMAREDGISLTLFPWDKGQVSQSKLTKFYRGQGFKPTVKGGKAMQWEPISERKQYPLEDFEGLKFRIIADGGQLFVNALDPTGGNELGHVTFDIGDGKELDPQNLYVKHKFRSQGIAKIMYDFVKSKGYKIQRSWDQTDAGAGFWDKHRGEDVRVWEQGVAEGLAENLNVDVPNEEWLQNAIDDAIQNSPTRNGLPYMGKTTATVRNVEIPISILKRIPGMRREQSNVRHRDLAAIRKIMSTTGKLPLHTHTQEEYKPFINVAYDGSAWVNEGNHRIMAAYELGWPSLPVEISYFDGGERMESGTMYPSKIGLA